MSITRDLVHYMVHAEYEKIPSVAIAKVKELILDDIGNAIGGSVLRSGEILFNWCCEYAVMPQATVIARGLKVPSWLAAGVNAQQAMALDFMETYRNMGHPGSGIVMSALALGEQERIPGKEIITAVCTAYDVAGRIIDATCPSPEFKGRVWNESWHVCGPLFAALRLLGLNDEQGMHALGMGLGNAPTLNVHNVLFIPGSMSKAANHLNVFAGIHAAALARRGYTGYHEVLDDPYGYWTTISDLNREDLYTKGLGEAFFISTAMALKPWPTCRWAQAGIESLLSIMVEAHLGPNNIDSVIYHAHEKITNYPYDSIDPKTPEDAYWTVPWAFANAALGHTPGPSWYTDERFGDKRLNAFMERVKIVTLPEAVEAFAREPEKSVTVLDVKDRSGGMWSRKSEYCKGDPQRPMTHEEVVEKFLGQTDGIIADDKTQRLIELVDDLENQEDISAIMECVF